MKLRNKELKRSLKKYKKPYQLNKPNKPKKQLIINTRPIISLLVGLSLFSFLLVVTMMAAAGDTKKSGKDRNKENKEEAQEELAVNGNQNSFLGVVKEIDQDNRLITLYDVDNEENKILSYNGGTNITDKYDQPIAVSQIQIGTMMDVTFLKDKDKLTDLQISTRAWEYVGVNNLSINQSSNVMKIASTKYKYTDDIIILDGQEFITISKLAKQDELTVRGYEETVWSMTVTRGHGTVRLSDYKSFLGASITI